MQAEALAQLACAMNGTPYQPVAKVLGGMGEFTEMKLPSCAKASAASGSASSVTPTQAAPTNTLTMTTPQNRDTDYTPTSPTQTETQTMTKTWTEPTPQSPTSPKSDYESDLEPVTLTADLDEKRQKAKAMGKVVFSASKIDDDGQKSRLYFCVKCMDLEGQLSYGRAFAHYNKEHLNKHYMCKKSVPNPCQIQLGEAPMQLKVTVL